jgi:octaprenyl-diphosphate synthase
MRAAEALELLHGAALIHDDIIDRATERRGRPALHVRIGIGPAIVLADYLILRCYSVLGDLDSPRCVEVMNTLSDYSKECCRGQVEELLGTTDSDPEESYLRIIRGKTASQFAAAVTIGAILGKGLPSEREALRRYALNVGIAFQIRDDELDLVGQPAIMGKPIGNSLEDGRPMLPIIYLEKYGSRAALEQYRTLRGCLRDRRSDLVNLLEQERIMDQVRVAQTHHVALALSELAHLRLSPAVNTLEAIAYYAIARHT